MPQASTLMRTSRGPGLGHRPLDQLERRIRLGDLNDAHGDLLDAIAAQSKIWASREAVENRLHRERGKQHAEYPHDHFPRGHADQLMDLLGEQEQHQRDRHHREDRGDDRAEQLMIALGAGGEHDGGGHGARARRAAAWRDGNTAISAWRSALSSASSLSLADSAAGPGPLRQRHLQRDREQDDAARGLQRGERDAELAQHRLARTGRRGG